MRKPCPEDIFALVVPSGFVHQAAEDSIVYSAVSDEVHVVLVFEGTASLRCVKPRDLLEMGLDETRSFAVAGLNLARALEANRFRLGFGELLDRTLIGLALGNWMAPAGALILLNFHEELSRQFRCDKFAAVAVNQEFLIAFPTDDATLASKSLRKTIDDSFRRHTKPVSRSWILLDGGWPKAYPGEQAF